MPGESAALPPVVVEEWGEVGLEVSLHLLRQFFKVRV
jgi:hypothetical protein